MQRIVHQALSWRKNIKERVAQQAIAAYEPVRLESVASVFVRIDVLLAVFWEGEDMYAVPMINEMDWCEDRAFSLSIGPTICYFSA